MDTPIADLMIHIDEMVVQPELGELVDTVRHDDGVITACMSERATHLMLVTYNPRRTTNQSILHAVTGRGYHAELVQL